MTPKETIAPLPVYAKESATAEDPWKPAAGQAAPPASAWSDHAAVKRSEEGPLPLDLSPATIRALTDGIVSGIV